MGLQRTRYQSIEQLLNVIQLACWEWDLRENDVVVTDEIYDIFGVTKDEFLNGNRFTDYIHPDDKAFVADKMEDALQRKKPFFIDYRIVTAGGENRVVQEKVELVLSNEGDIIKVLGVIIDVTDLHRAPSSYNMDYQLTLADRKGVYGNWEWDFTTKKLYLSSESCIISGLNLEETQTFREAKISKLIDSNDYPRVMKAVQTAMTLGYLNVEFQINKPNGDSSIIHIQGEVIKGDNRYPIRMLGTVRDVSHLIEREEAVLKTEKLSVVSQLAAGIAHEILNPLTSIRGFLKFYKEAGMKEEYYSIINKEFERVEFIVNELLMLAKPRVYQLSNQHIPDLIDQACSTIQEDYPGKIIRVNKHYQSNLPTMNCVKTQLHQVFVNLLQNASESIEDEGIIDITVQMISASKMKITIEDTGSGIPVHLLNKLGEPFYTTKEKGTGLGLMVCHRIIQNHAGLIQLHRNEPTGTRVDVIIPLSF